MKKIYPIILLLILFGCDVRENSNENKSVFRYNEAAGITSLDPAFAKDQSNIWACNQIFNGLVQFNEKMEIIPCIAKFWKISDDGKTYTFVLRQDVFFHDDVVFDNRIGRKVNAYDFEFSFNRIVDPKIASPGSWVFNNIDKHNYANAFEAINDTTFQIQLKKAFPPFLGVLAMQYCSVVPEEAIVFYGKDFRRNPVGTGPFKFKMWAEGIKLVLLRNDKYFEFYNGERLPYLDAVAVSFLIDKQSAFLEFILGNLDFMSGIDARYKDELLTKNGKLNSKYIDKFRLITQPYLNTEYLGILVDDSDPKALANPLSSKYLRQAVNYGFDRKKMMKYLRNNIGTPGNYGMIPKGLPAFDTSVINGYYYNPDKARQLIIKAGFTEDNKIPPVNLSTTAEYLDICKFIQHQLNEIGFDINIDVNPPGAIKEMKAQAKLNFFRSSWIADYPDAENYLSLFYSGNFCPQGPNYTHFSNEEFDDLYEISQNEINDSVRISLYRKMDNIVIEQAPVVVLFYDQVLRFVHNNVSGLGSNPTNLLNLKYVRKVKE